MSESPLNAALREFEATESNLVRAEKVLTEIKAAMPDGEFFAERDSFEWGIRDLNALLTALPTIDDWKPDIQFVELKAILQDQSGAEEIGNLECFQSAKSRIAETFRQLRDYRLRFNRKRRKLVRGPLIDLIDEVDVILNNFGDFLKEDRKTNEHVTGDEFAQLKTNVAQIGTLLGTTIPKPPRWSELHRHMSFGMVGDLHDIVKLDWPSAKAGLRESMYGEREPIPVDVNDLGTLVRTAPTGSVATKLKWQNLTDEDFERLIFRLISSTNGYENPEWLCKTKAADRGRDMSVWRVYVDPLAGTKRLRTIIQCKHWQSKSIGIAEVQQLLGQMKLCGPPRVDVLVIATSGRFTLDSVALIEEENESDHALRIEPWPESHLERLLASRPDIIAGFGLR